MAQLLHVVVPTPAHSTVGGTLSYSSELPYPPGTLVRVPLGRREVCGVVWETPAEDAVEALDPAQLRPVGAVLDGLPPLSAGWRQLVAFTAGYYQRSLGEVALAALPPQLRALDAVQLARRLQRKVDDAPAAPGGPAPDLSADQAQALAAIGSEPGPFLLFGATGSGKTEVYLRAVQSLMERDPQAQALVLVPEINLTPQLQARFEHRFGAGAVVALHSGMTNPQRLKSWIAAHLGRARIVLGTRMAVFASLPRLGLIVVDEEHDPSYKQQEGARYSARDLAVYRARAEGAKVVLGSATPSLESWQACDRGRYRCLEMPTRIGAGKLPAVRLVNMNHQPRGALFSPPLLDAIGQRVARGEQSLVFLNRRGYAPVLACNACDWKSECSHCSAFRVFHKIDRTLRCHHCGFTERVPRACPQCGNVDIAPVGRGTERLEEQLGELLADVRRPDGTPVRIARMDADSTRLKGALEQQLAQVHAGEVDVLVGTQMVTKGHDFRTITLVAAVNPDSALYSSDFRAPERLFSLLMQAAGRAGRDAARAAASEMWVQTFSPEHPLFAALKKHDYPAFAEQQLRERRQAAMPPFAYQALLRAEARTQEVAQAFLQSAADAGPGLEGGGHVVIYAPVPMTVQRVANVERAQLLLECGSRPALQAFLAAWQPVLQGLRVRGLIRWAIDVDPLVI
ncbi:MAG TPA: primosomal protein N' [Ramlibacter sp.]|uniref:primosomal protein N' n=1 Tax=Ramlibacter sp. TaxID=1917967 RepID=UPI002D7E98A6|nr:primosomal protein N' [Ramlibacter sp.]HET8746669.1 primosomal protein N' [Ramlibacter sp.]